MAERKTEQKKKKKKKTTSKVTNIDSTNNSKLDWELNSNHSNLNHLYMDRT